MARRAKPARLSADWRIAGWYGCPCRRASAGVSARARVLRCGLSRDTAARPASARRSSLAEMASVRVSAATNPGLAWTRTASSGRMARSRRSRIPGMLEGTGDLLAVLRPYPTAAPSR